MENNFGPFKFEMPIKLPRDKVINTFGNIGFQISELRLWRVIRIYTLVCIKDRNDQPNEEVHKTKSGKNPSTGVFVCWSWSAWYKTFTAMGPWSTMEEINNRRVTRMLEIGREGAGIVTSGM